MTEGNDAFNGGGAFEDGDGFLGGGDDGEGFTRDFFEGEAAEGRAERWVVVRV